MDLHTLMTQLSSQNYSLIIHSCPSVNHFLPGTHLAPCTLHLAPCTHLGKIRSDRAHLTGCESSLSRDENLATCCAGNAGDVMQPKFKEKLEKYFSERQTGQGKGGEPTG